MSKIKCAICKKYKDNSDILELGNKAECFDCLKKLEHNIEAKYGNAKNIADND